MLHTMPAQCFLDADERTQPHWIKLFSDLANRTLRVAQFMTDVNPGWRAETWT